MLDDKLGVLLIEGDRESRSYYSLALGASANFTVNIAASAEEALDIIESTRKGEIDIVILNTKMSDMPFYVILQRIRNHVATFQAYIFLFSSDLTPEDEFILKEMSVKGIMKPKLEANLFINYINENTSEKAKYGSNNVDSLVYELEFYLKTSNMDKCIELMENEKIKKFIEENQEYIHLTGEYHILKKDPEKTCEILNEYIHKNRGSQEVSETIVILNCLGKALCLCGKFKEAGLIYNKMAEKSPKNLNHKINLGSTHLGKGEWSQAAQVLKEVLDIDPYNEQALIKSAQAQVGLENHKEANSLLEKVAGSVDHQAIASYFNNRGIASSRTGEHKAAVDFYKNALFFTKKQSGKVLFNLGLALYRNNKLDEAKKVFTKISSTEDSEYLNSSKNILQSLINEKVNNDDFDLLNQEEGIDENDKK